MNLSAVTLVKTTQWFPQLLTHLHHLFDICCWREGEPLMYFDITVNTEMAKYVENYLQELKFKRVSKRHITEMNGMSQGGHDPYRAKE
jgi:hypothetical protein